MCESVCEREVVDKPRYPIKLGDERALLTAAWEKDVKTLTSLLEKSVCHHVHV